MKEHSLASKDLPLQTEFVVVLDNSFAVSASHLAMREGPQDTICPFPYAWCDRLQVDANKVLVGLDAFGYIDYRETRLATAHSSLHILGIVSLT